MSLINSLKKEHDELRDFLAMVESVGASSDEGRVLLIRSKCLFIAHLEKEDRLLYPALEQLEETQTISHSFRKEMAAISEQAYQFFEHLCEGILLGRQIEVEFSMLSAVLRARMFKEEMSLYKSYTDYSHSILPVGDADKDLT